MPQRFHAEVPQILICQARQKSRPDIITLERFGILRKAERREPRCDGVHEISRLLNSRGHYSSLCLGADLNHLQPLHPKDKPVSALRFTVLLPIPYSRFPVHRSLFAM